MQISLYKFNYKNNLIVFILLKRERKAGDFRMKIVGKNQAFLVPMFKKGCVKESCLIFAFHSLFLLNIPIVT